MSNYWAVMLPLIRPLLMRVALFFAVAIVGLGAVWGVEQWQTPRWKSAQQSMQAANSSVSQANVDLADVERLSDDFARYRQSGAVGGAPRAGWIEDLQRLAGSMGLEPVMTYNLASPVVVTTASTGSAKVTRHALTVSINSVHELEGLKLVQAFVGMYPYAAQLSSCEFNAPTDVGMAITCKVNLLHIDSGESGAAGVQK